MKTKEIFCVGVGLCGFGWLLNLIGMATTSWTTCTDVTRTVDQYGIPIGRDYTTCLSWSTVGLYRGKHSEEEWYKMMKDIKYRGGLFGVCGTPVFAYDFAKGMTVLGFILVLAAIATAFALVIMARKGEDKRWMPMAAGALAVAAGVFVILGVCVWAGEVNAYYSWYDKTQCEVDACRNRRGLGYSFGLCLAGAVFMIAGGGIFFWMDHQMKNGDRDFRFR